ncbi:MBL fold metallo-hydrolase [Mucilaginibacter sp. X4EP1]|jgi:L-ascorbate metabolism protein UlaG (beta-lactamase superfamily)|uniref:MBL fold metallo-hydrolase n=2 Tax=unclassified Mucilaginibacter TaxID=2617802 RepID=UPI002168A16E|nr:MBL fold metallo-hydrolase [Mucilaginibacter sp. X4EP1]MCS3812690.1 L-ascorbate metabolism protein UlaG (beta-lactamase superfamily) [Mucilaginibacter sp. X4EP1]
MNIQLLRNATLVLTIDGKTLLVDPMLAPKDSYDVFPFSNNELRNPLVDLPLYNEQLHALIAKVEAVLLTHLHIDHWDLVAQQMLPKDIMILCQPVDAHTISASGFTNVIPVADELIWNGALISRVNCKHGVGAITDLTGVVSGYVISTKEERLYIAGDTVWYEDVEQTLDRFRPTHIILNGGAARFVIGDPIIMNIADIIKVCKHAPLANIYVVHLESVNSVTENRIDISNAVSAHNLSHRCHVPADGDLLF